MPRIYNFTHPLTDAQLDQLAIEWNIEAEEVKVISITVQVEQSEPLLPQVEALLPTGYDTDSYIVMPGLAVVAAVLTRELLSKHGFIKISFDCAQLRAQLPAMSWPRSYASHETQHKATSDHSHGPRSLCCH